MAVSLHDQAPTRQVAETRVVMTKVMLQFGKESLTRCEEERLAQRTLMEKDKEPEVLWQMARRRKVEEKLMTNNAVLRRRKRMGDDGTEVNPTDAEAE